MTTKADEPDRVKDLIGHEQLLPIAPMLYVAWADGDLTDEEIRKIREAASRQEWLDGAATSTLNGWLDPESPPSATRLERLSRAIAESAEKLDIDERASLADLGVQIARLEGPGEEPEWLDEDVHSALLDLEKSVGVVSEEATHALLHGLDRPGFDHADEPPPRFDVAAMTRLLDEPWGDQWEKVREILRREEFELVYGLPKEEHREKVLEWVKILADEGLGRITAPDGESSMPMGRFMAAFEALGMFDLSLVVKFGVQFGLFGGSIASLGTARHHEAYLDDIASLKLPGGFAMTELGHGSNVRDLQTTATYDVEAEEFVIDTPHEEARKEWIGNAAAHGRMMTVFAQLRVGEDEYGVHAFLVPVRDEDGEVVDGVRIEDCGHKMGLNGVDNGRLWFDEVRVPRENLLDRYGSVAADGSYESPIPSAGKRFFTMLGTLVGGRVSVAAAATTATKVALAIATRYSAARRQFGAAGEPETPILNYRTHQRRLMPCIATTYGLDFAVDKLRQRYLKTRGHEDTREVEAMAAALKSFGTWAAIDSIQQARECCGGMGFLTENRIAQIRRDVDVFATFEGDNVVLMMLVARNLLSDYQQQFSEASVFSLARYLADRASGAIRKRNPLVTRETDPAHLRSAEFQLNAFRTREDDLLNTAARRLKRRLDDGVDSFDAFNQVQDHLLSLSKAYAERLVMEAFVERIEKVDDDELRRPLELMRDLYATFHLHDDIGWYLENGYIEPAKSRAIRDLLNDLCFEARKQAIALVDAWGIPDEVLSAPIAFVDRHP
ncbi:MAG: acyl-CoA dehydrogenase [Persicimonas sp.]